MIIFLSILLLFSSNANCKNLNYNHFAKIPILQDGRVKPMKSFAIDNFKKLNASYKNGAALQNFAKAIFRPDLIISDRIIKIENENLIKILAFEPRKSKLYSMEEAALAYQLQQKKLFELISKPNPTEIEQEFLDLYSKINNFSKITRSLTLVLPIPAKKPDNIMVKGNSYFDFAAHRKEIFDDWQKIIDQKKSDISKYSQQEKDLTAFVFNLKKIEKTGHNNDIFKVIPSFIFKDLEYYSPWQLVNEGHGSPNAVKLIEKWHDLSMSYYSENQLEFDKNIDEIIEIMASNSPISKIKMNLEIIYNTIDFLSIALLAYVISIVSKIFNFTNLISKLSLLIALISHASLMILRILILSRAPVGTLYESILFVSFIVGICGLSSRGNLLITNLVALLLLLSSFLYVPNGDSLGVLVAVLNSNFWLVIHVLCISCGYAACFVAGSLAHYYLINPKKHTEMQWMKKLQFFTIISMILTSIGTILGGIWADQSWGRFWGWDPKENGALLIILWISWILHGKITGHFKGAVYASLLAFLNVIVAISWFGVNLLGVGLHSYGFTDEAANTFMIFCLVEIIAISSLFLRHQKKYR